MCTRKFSTALAHDPTGKCWPCCLLQVATLTGVTRERSTTGKGTTRFQEVKLPAAAALTSRGGGTESLLSPARATDSKRIPSRVHTCPLPLYRDRGKKEMGMVLTAISFWLLEREHISMLKKRKRGPGLWKPSPSKKGRP